MPVMFHDRQNKGVRGPGKPDMRRAVDRALIVLPGGGCFIPGHQRVRVVQEDHQ